MSYLSAVTRCQELHRYDCTDVARDLLKRAQAAQRLKDGGKKIRKCLGSSWFSDFGDVYTEPQGLLRTRGWSCLGEICLGPKYMS